jgi:alanyl-tRNA synthetase
MDSQQLRRVWNEFWTERGHTIVPSASLIPTHPTAPMFTNSGMMQFVPYFLGEEKAPFDPPRAADIQKCVRVGGKHNDLDVIGTSIRHLSFFEMLGNWSFGEYFKVEAIRWAWELVTETLGFDPDRLWVTVHVNDDDAADIWHDEVGFPVERIHRLDKDNFWEMGDTGPCGPDSELFFDRGPAFGPDGGPENKAAEDRFVEFWNLVFMQYFRRNDGSLVDLPRKNVDTGGGLERFLMLLNGYSSLFETDVLLPIVDAAQSVTGLRLGADERGDHILRLLADHTRTMTFLVNDGVIPSNEDRGYVLRRIIRRAVRFAYLAGVEQVVTPRLIEATVATMGDAYPDLRANHTRITDIVGREEERFRATLARGLTILDAALEYVDKVGGDLAFQLHDTFGFPLEVTQEIAGERGIEVDADRFDALMGEQRERAKAAARKGDHYEHLDSFQDVLDRFGPTEFVGRQEYEVKAQVLAIVGDSILLDRSPFYAEQGGQIGDTGWITTDTGRARIIDCTYALPGLHRHHVAHTEGEVTPGQSATAVIDADRREEIRRNHTGTHVIHWAIREVLGSHVKQQGSLVAPDRLRFDFGPADPLTPEQIRAVEDIANREILENHPVRAYETSREHADELGAIAFFGEKYGDVVRVVEAGPHSTELCGGTHVRSLGDIGPLKIVSEQSIGANIRRIDAVTGFGTIERLRRDEDLLGHVAEVLNVPVGEVVDGARRRIEENRSLRDELRSLRAQAARARAGTLASEAVDGVVVARVDGIGRDELRDLALAIRQKDGVRAVVLGGAPEGGGAALISVVVPDSGLHAGELIAEAARAIHGGAGRSPEFAQAGGKDPSRLDEALDLARRAAGV